MANNESRTWKDLSDLVSDLSNCMKALKWSNNQLSSWTNLNYFFIAKLTSNHNEIKKYSKEYLGEAFWKLTQFINKTKEQYNVSKRLLLEVKANLAEMQIFETDAIVSINLFNFHSKIRIISIVNYLKSIA